MNGSIVERDVILTQPSNAVAGPSRLPYNAYPPSREAEPNAGTVNGLAAVPYHASSHLNGDGQILDAQEEARTGWVYSSSMMQHKPLTANDDHPERPERIYAIYRILKDNGLIERMKRIHVREAILEEIRLVHAEDQWKRIQDTADYPLEHLEAIAPYYSRHSLYINSATALSARLSCGSVIDMCRAVAEGRIQNGFAIVRPPGHHAEPDMEMGFCLYNNVAVAAQWLLLAMPQKVQRILVLDWDVHHGNGTQKAFYDDGRVLYISIHRHEDGNFYPGGDYGGADKCGEVDGLGRNVNIPWRTHGMGDADYMYAFQQIVMPIGLEFNPDLVIVSAGFDAALGDPLGECRVTPAGFAHMTHQLSALAAGKVVLALEGGYNIDAIAPSALACTQSLLGDSPGRLESLTASEAATLDINIVSRMQSEHWKSIKPMKEKRESLPEETLTLSLTDVLKMHRSHYLYSNYGLVNVDLAQNEEGAQLASFFEHQVFASENVYSSELLVLYIHDMGTIHAELNGLCTDASLEKSFLLENTKLVLDWVTQQNFAVIDVNILPHQSAGNATPLYSTAALQATLAEHLWEYFINLSVSRNVVLIGQGSGCSAIGQIVRNKPVQQKVKAIVQIPGRERPPTTPKDADKPGLRQWYYDVSVVVVPRSHELLDDQHKGAQRFGKLFGSEETHPSKVVVQSWPAIAQHLEKRLGKALIDEDPSVMHVEPAIIRSNTPMPPAPPHGALATHLHPL